MDVADIEIRTPYDFPHAYQVNWRQEVARYAETMRKEACPFPADAPIRMQASYLREINDPQVSRRMSMSPFKRGAEFESKIALHQANTIYRSTGSSSAETLKDKLEAMLLCPELSFDQIARSIGVSEEAVKLYESLFYNVREPDGKTKMAPWLREYFATQGAAAAQAQEDSGPYWKALAIEGGARVLFHTWGWKIPDSKDDDFPEREMAVMMMRQLSKSLDHKVRFGNIDSKSLVALYGEFNAALIDMRERGVIAGTGTASEDDVMFRFLSLLQPKMQEVDENVLLEKAEELETSIRRLKHLDKATDANKLDTLAKIDSQVKG